MSTSLQKANPPRVISQKPTLPTTRAFHTEPFATHRQLIPQVFFKGNIKDVLLRSSGFLCLPCPLYRKAVGTRSYFNRTAALI